MNYRGIKLWVRERVTEKKIIKIWDHTEKINTINDFMSKLSIVLSQLIEFILFNLNHSSSNPLFL